ncbi:putative LigA [Burkholderiales bacterium 8X]|nr:putative LigA [Burkholderiales bacterium 8X]
MSTSVLVSKASRLAIDPPCCRSRCRADRRAGRGRRGRRCRASGALHAEQDAEGDASQAGDQVPVQRLAEEHAGAERREPGHDRRDHGRSDRPEVLDHPREGDARYRDRADALEHHLERDFAQRRLGQPAGDEARAGQQRVRRHVGQEGEGRDRDRGAHGLQPVPPHQHAVAGPGEGCAHEEQVALPHVAAVQCMQEAGPADQEVARDDQHQADGAGGMDAVVQEDGGEQRRPERKASRHEHRGMGGRREEEAAVGQHGVGDAAERTGHHRDPKRQRRQAEERACVRPLLAARLHHQPGAPGQQHQGSAPDAHEGEVERREAPGGRSARDDDEGRPDQHRDHRCPDADRAGRKTGSGDGHRAIIEALRHAGRRRDNPADAFSRHGFHRRPPPRLARRHRPLRLLVDLPLAGGRECTGAPAGGRRGAGTRQGAARRGHAAGGRCRRRTADTARLALAGAGQSGVDHEAGHDLCRARHPRPGLCVDHAGVRRRAGAERRARGQLVHQGARRSEAGAGAALAAAAARAGPRHPHHRRRHRARPQRLRGAADRSECLRRRGFEAVQRDARRAARQLQVGRDDLCAGSRHADRAGQLRTVPGRRLDPGHPSAFGRRLRRLAQRGRGRGLRSRADRLRGQLSGGVRREDLVGCLCRPAGLCRPRRGRTLGRDGLAAQGPRTRRTGSGGRQAGLRGRVTAAFGGDPRHQQVQQQRDGAAALPDARPRAEAPRQPRKRTHRDAPVVEQPHRHRRRAAGLRQRLRLVARRAHHRRRTGQDAAGGLAIAGDAGADVVAAARRRRWHLAPSAAAFGRRGAPQDRNAARCGGRRGLRAWRERSALGGGGHRQPCQCRRGPAGVRCAGRLGRARQLTLKASRTRQRRGGAFEGLGVSLVLLRRPPA